MEIMGIIFILIALVVLLSPWLQAEDRPDFLRPDGKARASVGAWFSGRRHS